MQSEHATELRSWFFVPPPRVPVLSLGVGLVFALTGLACAGMASGDRNGGSAVGIGMLLLLVGVGSLGIAAVSWSNQSRTYAARPSDDDVDAWTEELLAAARAHALDRTGTDATELVGETVVVTGPRHWETGASRVGYRKGADGILRFTPLGVTVLNFTTDRLLAYSCALDLFTGNPLNESTDEYYYKDVVSVSTKTRSETIRRANGTPLQLHAAEVFELTTSGGTSVSVLLRDPTLVKSRRRPDPDHPGGEGDPDGAQDAA